MTKLHLPEWIFQEETRNLRRQLYDKRPVVENKLLWWKKQLHALYNNIIMVLQAMSLPDNFIYSGRQFLASEPTPSDTSDSDSKTLHGMAF